MLFIVIIINFFVIIVINIINIIIIVMKLLCGFEFWSAAYKGSELKSCIN